MPSIKISREFVRAMLQSHSILGLTAAALLYIVCVTGTFSVFYPQFERWEQPDVVENVHVDGRAINAALGAAFAREPTRPEHLFITLATPEVPRVAVHAGETTGFVHADGTLGSAVDHEWTHFLVELHYALTVPGTVGFTIVGVLGVLMLAMVISGLFAHPNIFKDAFSFRVNGPKRLQQVDIHNRLSVWTAPFQIAIAVTGAFIGLSQVYSFLLAATFFEGDTDRATHSLFVHPQKPTGITAPLPDVGSIVERFQDSHPDLPLMYVTVHEPGTTAQAVEIAARVPRRLAWAELFLYAPSGELLDTAGWATGDLGAQLYAASFRLHFGHFGGSAMQFAYLALGLALCVVIATGMNIWMVRRAQAGRPTPTVHALWITIVWGTPFGLALSALLDVLFGTPGTPVFWVILLLLLGVAAFTGPVAIWSRRLRGALAFVCAAVVAAHMIRYQEAAITGGALLINVLWLLLAGGAAASLLLVRTQRSAREIAAADASVP